MFSSRWLQAPIYLGLIVALGIYVCEFMIQLWELIDVALINRTNERFIVLNALDLIDVVMIANLIIMVIVGGYETFVSRLNLEDHPDEPEWLSHINSGTLKLKLALSIITIASVHLLKSFIDIETMSTQKITLQISIGIFFLLAALVFLVVERSAVKIKIESKQEAN